MSVEPLFRAPPLRFVRRRAIVSTSLLGTALILPAFGKMLENSKFGIYFAHLMDPLFSILFGITVDRDLLRSFNFCSIYFIAFPIKLN